MKLRSPIKLQSPVVKSYPSGPWNNREYVPDFIAMSYLQDLWGGGAKLMKDFLEVPELNNIINLRARAMASGNIDVINKATDQPEGSNSLSDVIRNPNFFQGNREFWRQSSLFRDIFGNEYIYFLTPMGMEGDYQAMFTLNPSSVDVKYKPQDNSPFFLNVDDEGASYTFTWNGRQYKLDKQDLVHLNDNRVQTTNILEGTSKIEALQANIRNIRAAYEKRNIALNMPVGILSNNGGSTDGVAVPFDPEEKKLLAQRIKTKKGEPIMTAQAVRYDAMEVNAARMGLFEETKEDTMKICDAYGYPYELLASQKTNSLSDGGGAVKERRKQMYEDIIIPDMKDKVASINNRVGTENLPYEIQVSFTHLPVFSEDRKEMADVNSKNMTGVDTILGMPITDDGKVILLVETYGYTEEVAKQIVKSNE